ncbi:MAG: HD-GYP domain-containing protein [Defluviitaleaceae bacterium]|nr:HD-GYP domain-containing protein [Defluviitaleaceae bacterium]
MYTCTIRTEDAKEGMKLSEPVYIVTTTGTNMLAARKDTTLDMNLIRMMTIRKVPTIQIYSETPPDGVEIPPLPTPVHKPAPASLQLELTPASAPQVTVQSTPEKPKPPPEKFVQVKALVDEQLRTEAVDSVRKLFACFSAHEGGINKTTAYQCVDNLEGVVGDLLGVLNNDTSGLIHINDLKHFDEYTYHHSLSVSMLAMSTGRELGLDSDSLFRLGRCAMMHDIGKQLIPLEIINKKGRLTDAEYNMVKNHSVLGASTLKSAAIGDVELWNGIMFHHEKVNGSGYPKGLKGKDMPLFSKIISVADVYDAVTSYRAYRTPMLPSEAFELISREVNVAFELDIVRAFFSKLELYPPNTIVELSDTRLGIVVESEGASRLRPVIRIWGSTELVNLGSAMNKGVSIIGVMNPADLPAGYEFA